MKASRPSAVMENLVLGLRPMNCLLLFMYPSFLQISGVTCQITIGQIEQILDGGKINGIIYH